MVIIRRNTIIAFLTGVSFALLALFVIGTFIDKESPINDVSLLAGLIAIVISLLTVLFMHSESISVRISTNREN